MRSLLVLPTYNEAENIHEVLRRLRAAAPDVHVLVVDDGSPDGTAGMARELADEIGHLEVLERNEKSGLGSAYRAGFRWGLERGYEAFVEMDADLSHDPAVVPSLLAAVEDGNDLVIGSRYVPGGSIPDWTLLRRAISRGGNLYARIVLGLQVQDATAGFRAYSAVALRGIDLPSVSADGYGFQVEMAYRVQQQGGRLAEIPIEFRDRTLGQSKMSSRIVVEALILVTWWGIRDLPRRLFGRWRSRSGPGGPGESTSTGRAARD